MFIASDEMMLASMLGIEPNAIPAEVKAEYSIRQQMFVACGGSGAMGPAILIDILRYLKRGPRPKASKPAEVDWSRVPQDGTVRIEARVPTLDGFQWVSGVYVGAVGVGTLAVRLAGDAYVHEKSRRDVRIAREKPAVAYVEPFDKTPDGEDPWWAGAAVGQEVFATDDDGEYVGTFVYSDADKIVVHVDGELKPRPFPKEFVVPA